MKMRVVWTARETLEMREVHRFGKCRKEDPWILRCLDCPYCLVEKP